MRSIRDYPFDGRGLQSRLSRIFDSKSGRTVLLAVDHGYFQGAPEGLKNLKKTIEPLLPYCDAISPCIGGLKYMNPWCKTPVILRATGGNSMIRPDELDDEIVTVSVDEMIRNNAIGFTVSCYIGFPHQRQTIDNLVSLTDEAHKHGLISIGITALGKSLKEDSKKNKKEKKQEIPGKNRKYLEHACRLLSENGADIVKTYYCKNFVRVVRSCLSPIVVAGGTKIETKEALDFTYRAIQSGAVGVDMGRNIFQDDYPVAMIKAVRGIVHDGLTSDEAYDFYKSSVGIRGMKKRLGDSYKRHATRRKR